MINCFRPVPALIILAFVLVACASSAGVGTTQPSSSDQVATIVAATMQAIPSNPPAPTTQPADESIVVAFVKDGNIHVWDSTTQQSETIFTSGDVTTLTMSDDGEVIAFTRHSLVGEQLDGYGQSALWAVDRNGDNPRELVSAESFHQRLNPRERETSSVSQLEWIPGTHRLLFSGWTYIVQGEGESHATPEGLYMVDTDTLAETVLVPDGNGLRFAPSPDGSQIALMFLDSFGFINVDGSDPHLKVLTYPAWQSTAPIFPKGAWVQDSQAFLLAAPNESGERFMWNFTIWRVPVDGSLAESLATVTDQIYPDSISFSPGGNHATYYGSLSGQPEVNRWFILSLAADVGPLAISHTYQDLWVTLHWSPADLAYTITEGSLFQLCPDATQITEVCGDPVNLGGNIAAIHWLDASRFLFLLTDSSTLFLGRLDGTMVPIVTARLEIYYGPQRFNAVLLTANK